MAHLAYFRVSTTDQSIDAQRHALGQGRDGSAFDKEFADEGISGTIPAKERRGFKDLTAYARQGDTVYVYAVDRLGRDALDVQATVRELLGKGVAVHVHGLGVIAKGAGELILAVLAQVADMERQRIVERTAAGRDKARQSLAETGKTHRGKASLGRQPAGDAEAVQAWRNKNGSGEGQRASIAKTAEHFGLSPATVKRYCAE